MNQENSHFTLAPGEYTGDILQSLNLEGSKVTRTLYASHNHNPEWHCHENLHIAFVYQKARAETQQQTLDIDSKGSMLFYHSGQMHRYTSFEATSKSANIEINDAFLQQYHLSEADIQTNITKNYASKSIMLSIQSAMMQEDAERPLEVESLLLELVSSQAQDYVDLPLWAKHLYELLNDRWNEPLSLQELSIALQVHPVTISKYFKRYFSCTLGEFRRKIKVERSIDLIKASKLSLGEIAHHCDFSDQSHFIRNFKKYTGFLPKEFRAF